MLLAAEGSPAAASICTRRGLQAADAGALPPVDVTEAPQADLGSKELLDGHLSFPGPPEGGRENNMQLYTITQHVLETIIFRDSTPNVHVGSTWYILLSEKSAVVQLPSLERICEFRGRVARSHFRGALPPRTHAEWKPGKGVKDFQDPGATAAETACW